MKKELLDTGTRNFNTMLKAGKMHEIVDQIVGSQIQIVALQEIRWRGYGLLRKINTQYIIAVIPIPQAKQE